MQWGRNVCPGAYQIICGCSLPPKSFTPSLSLSIWTIFASSKSLLFIHWLVCVAFILFLVSCTFFCLCCLCRSSAILWQVTAGVPPVTASQWVAPLCTTGHQCVQVLGVVVEVWGESFFFCLFFFKLDKFIFVQLSSDLFGCSLGISCCSGEAVKQGFFCPSCYVVVDFAAKSA